MVNKDYNIDAVITWVDGNDETWQKKINKFLVTKIDFKKKKESIRYNSIGEIDIAIKSIIKYAPFLKNIYLVTDNQRPGAFDNLVNLAKQNKINLELIDHTVIFKDHKECLPCFNSASIGCMLYNIPNLSEHFIIFNDDTFLMRETTPNDFFRDGEPVIRGQWEKFNDDRILRKIYHKVRKAIGIPKKEKVSSFKKFQQTSAKLAGAKKYVRRFHTPVSARKSTIENFFSNNDELLRNNVANRFRNQNQFIISSLSEHLEIMNNSFHYSNNAQLTYFRSYKSLSSTKQKLKKFMKNKNKRFMTFQSLELADEQTLNYILAWIDDRLK